MSTLARSISAARGRLLIRLEAVHDGHTFDGVRTKAHIAWGESKLRALTQDEATHHETLCRAFGLDPHRTRIELPSSARGTGSAVSGAGGARGNREISGFVFVAGKDEPIAKIIFEHEGRQIRDVDPQDRREFERLG